MPSLVLTKQDGLGYINGPLLDEELRAALSDYQSYSIGGGCLELAFADSATPDQMDTARKIVFAHDARKLTTWQQAEKDRRERIAALKAEIEADAGKPPTIAILLKRIELLELERHV